MSKVKFIINPTFYQKVAQLAESKKQLQTNNSSTTYIPRFSIKIKEKVKLVKSVKFAKVSVEKKKFSVDKVKVPAIKKRLHSKAEHYNFYMSYNNNATDLKYKDKLEYHGSNIQYKKLTLLPGQVDHFNKMCQIVAKNSTAFDGSWMGKGKTIIAAMLACYLKKPALIICPAIAESNVWAKEALIYGLNIIDIISYDKLRGIKGKECNHPYLIRDKNNKFHPTEKLKLIIRQGVIVIIDEISKAINPKTGILQAIRAITNTLNDPTLNGQPDTNRDIYKCDYPVIHYPDGTVIPYSTAPSQSYGHLISTMPCDNSEQYISLCQMLGLTNKAETYFYNNFSKEYELNGHGFKDIVNWCLKRDETETKKIMARYNSFCKNTIPKAVEDLYDKIISQEISSAMLSSNNLQITNMFYVLDKEDVDIMNNRNKKSNPVATVVPQAADVTDPVNNQSIRSMLDEALNNVKSIGKNQNKNKRGNWSQITNTLKTVGKVKLRKTYQAVKEDLDSDPNRKVVIGPWYVDHIQWLVEAFKDYGAQVIYGAIENTYRQDIIDFFQRPDGLCRVLVINPTVAGMCISLDDRYGNFPRSLYLYADYRIKYMVQMTGRVFRETTVNPEQTKIIIVYASQFKEELLIVKALMAKSSHAKRTIKNNVGLVLPDNYLNVYEEKYNPPSFPLPKLLMLSEMDIKDSNQYDIWK